MTNIFVGNLHPETSEEQLLNLFAAHGSVTSVTLVIDRDTGRPRGFAFVEMKEAQEAQAAVSSLNGALLNGHTIRVNEARPKTVHDASGRSAGARNHRNHRM